MICVFLTTLVAAVSPSARSIEVFRGVSNVTIKLSAVDPADPSKTSVIEVPFEVLHGQPGAAGTIVKKNNANRYIQ
jgi:hypothetical protein